VEITALANDKNILGCEELPGAIEKQRGYLKLIFEGQKAIASSTSVPRASCILLTLNNT
jgi:hypothetical protein